MHAWRQMCEWDEAAELAVTREEKEDLQYLMQRQQREKQEGGQYGGRRSGGPAFAQSAPVRCTWMIADALRALALSR